MSSKKIKQRSNKIKLIIGVSSLILLIVFSIISLCIPEVEIILNNDDNINLNFGDDYIEYGATGYIKKLFNRKEIDVKVMGEVDSNKIGKYLVTYYYKDNKIKGEKVRVVNVLDNEKPIITLNKEVTVCKNGLVNLDVTAIDNLDGDISNLVQYKIKNDKIDIFVKDSSNNKESITLDIKNIDNEKPIITLNGNNIVNVKLGSTYNEEGAKAYDSCDGDLTHNITISGDVDINKLGKYIINYSVKDSLGNISKIIREVNVTNNMNGVVYLTFDDGPSIYTQSILDTLNKYNVKATFFVTYQSQARPYVNMIKKEYDAGHTIGIHTYSHTWDIYDSVDKYLEDFNKMDNIIYEQIGIHPSIFRFPGGSSNMVSKSHSKGIMTKLAHLLTEKGYTYYDWNFDCGDTVSGKNSVDGIINEMKKLKMNKTYVVLMHDNKKNTSLALPTVVDYLIKEGFQIKPITEATPVVHHNIVN